MTTLHSVPRTTAYRVISEMTGQLALRSQHLAMQIIAFHVGDRSTVNANLVYMSRPIMQPVDRALAGDRGADAIAEFIIGMREPAVQVDRVRQRLVTGRQRIQFARRNPDRPSV
ncbi:hypothetical protein WL74_01820 [Burkholderia cepacia]|uniref:hypothetical protein n=1 Tax=Burkholderia cepacia TaxID=292 RepID=UPI00075F817D|nr:hypothetical protein [Burkholderia cepacia]KWE26648.1 hypothetical protein WL74_01820 [Burkholderia cepacia]